MALGCQPLVGIVIFNINLCWCYLYRSTHPTTHPSCARGTRKNITLWFTAIPIGKHYDGYAAGRYRNYCPGICSPSIPSGGAMVPKGITSLMETLVEALYNLTKTSAGKWAKEIFPWFATIFIIVLVANLWKLVPGFETVGILHQSEHGNAIQNLFGNVHHVLSGEVAHGEETYQVVPWFRGLSTDLNFTAALALISVVMTQVIGVRAQKAWYFTKFFNFTTIFKKPALGFMDFIVGILELISELAKILSFAFRLFGVMFSGTVLVALVGVMAPVFIPSLVFMFELFMGVIQAFVFGMLTLVFMAQATQGHGEHADH